MTGVAVMAPVPRQVQRVEHPPLTSDFMPERTANITSVDLGPVTSSPSKFLPLRHLKQSLHDTHLHLAPNAFSALIAATSASPMPARTSNDSLKVLPAAGLNVVTAAP